MRYSQLYQAVDSDTRGSGSPRNTLCEEGKNWLLRCVIRLLMVDVFRAPALWVVLSPLWTFV